VGAAAADVDTSWTRIEAWLSRYAPGFRAALNPPADRDVIQRVEREIGVELPADLVAWWRGADGVDHNRVTSPRHLGDLIPDFCNPLSVAEALEYRDMNMRVAREVCPPELRSELEAWTARCSQDPAGTLYPNDASGAWPPTWLPIASDYGGGGLFADLRTGPLHGCLVHYDRMGHADTSAWPSIAALWAHVADVLETVTEEDFEAGNEVKIGYWAVPHP
jgi:cell wall assembly regulator SMI1